MIEFVKTLTACMAFIVQKLAKPNPALPYHPFIQIVLTHVEDLHTQN